MKKSVQILFWGVLLATLFASCKQVTRDGLDDRKDESELISPKLQGLTFVIKFPGGEGVNVPTEAQKRAMIQDEPEWKVEKLWMFEFDKDSEKLTAEPIDLCANGASGQPAALAQVTGQQAVYTWSSNQWGPGEVRKFFFVANVDKPSVTVNTTTLSQLKEMLLKKNGTGGAMTEMTYETSNPSSKDILFKKNGATPEAYLIPMSGQGLQNGHPIVETTPGSKVVVELVRAVARIDIVNQIPGFKIKEIKLYNTFDKGSLAPMDNNGKEATGATRNTAGISPFTPISNGGLVGKRPADDSSKLKKAFYLYEGSCVADASQCTYVEIKADWGSEKDKIYKVYFKNGANFTNPINVKRNHLYTIVIGEDYTDLNTKVSFAFKDEPWNLHQLVSVFNLYRIIGKDFIRDTATSGTLSFFASDEDADTKTLKVHTDFVEHTQWATPIISSDAQDWLEASITGAKDATLTVKLKDGKRAEFKAQNPSSNESKIGTITIISKVAPSAKYTINVVMKKKSSKVTTDLIN